MKKIFNILVLLSAALTASAQYEPQYSMFVFNKLAYNPAYAGSKECLDITALYRNQWTGFAGAPNTAVVSAHTPFASNRCGIGLTLVNDRIGLLNNVAGTLAYAYRIKTGKGILSLGLQGELEFTQTRWQDARPATSANLDPVIPDANDSKIFPNFGAGIYYYQHNFFAGISAPRLLKTSYYRKDGLNSGVNPKDKRTYFGMAGMVFDLTKDVKFRPSVLISYNPSAPFEWVANASFMLRNALWLGASYRADDSIDAFLQYQFNSNLRAGLGYDFTISKLANYTNGSFEVMVEYLFICCGKDEKIRHIRYF